MFTFQKDGNLILPNKKKIGVFILRLTSLFFLIPLNNLSYTSLCHDMEEHLNLELYSLLKKKYI